MIRKMLLVAAAVAMPVGVIAVTAGPAAALPPTIDQTGPPATASCTLSGGTLTFKVPIGIVTAGGYQAPPRTRAIRSRWQASP